MEGTDDLTQLVTLSQKRDLGAFQRLYELTYPRFAKLAFLLTGQAEAADDALQDAFLLCHQKIASLSDASKFLPWMRTIVVRVALKSSRTRRRDPGLDEPDLRESLACRSGEDQLEFKMARHAVRKALASLPAHQVAVLVLYYFEELSIEQIAEAVGCREGTVKSRLHYGKKRLQKLLQDFSGENSASQETSTKENSDDKKLTLIRT